MKSLIIAILLVSSPAFGTVYRWNDSAGIAHYTNREYDIPDRYKSRAKALYPEAGDSRTGSPAGSGEQKTPNVPPAPVAAVQQPAPTPSAVVQQQAPAPVVEAQPKNVSARAARRAKRERVRESEEE